MWLFLFLNTIGWRDITEILVWQRHTQTQTAAEGRIVRLQPSHRVVFICNDWLSISLQVCKATSLFFVQYQAMISMHARHKPYRAGTMNAQKTAAPTQQYRWTIIIVHTDTRTHTCIQHIKTIARCKGYRKNTFASSCIRHLSLSLELPFSAVSFDILYIYLYILCCWCICFYNICSLAFACKWL